MTVARGSSLNTSPARNGAHGTLTISTVAAMSDESVSIRLAASLSRILRFHWAANERNPDALISDFSQFRVSIHSALRMGVVER